MKKLLALVATLMAGVNASARRRGGRVLVAVLCLQFPIFAFASAPAQAAPADLDTTFDTDGKVTTDFGRYDSGSDVAIQPDGRIVVAGSSGPVGFYIPEDPPPGSDFALARYNADGSLDPTFGTGGKVTTHFALHDSDDSFAEAVAIQPDGRIVVAGYSHHEPHGLNLYDFALARYNADGSLDLTFGIGGKVTTDFDTYDVGLAVAIQPDGSIVVAGYSEMDTGASDFALARYTASGILDPTFGTAGKVTTDFGSGNDYGGAVAIDSDNRIVVAGNVLARYTADGILDTTFGTGGWVTDFGAAVAIQPDGQIVVAGTSVGPDFALARYTANGSLDTTFGTDGKVTTDFGTNDYGRAVALQPDGRIVMAGSSVVDGSGYPYYYPSDFALARYNADGSLDTTFGTGGKVTTTIDTPYGYGEAVALQPDGRIVMAGSSGSDFAVVRYEGGTGAAAPALSVNDVTVTEGDTGTTNATFTVTLSVESAQTVTVDYATTNGTATAPEDYISAAGPVTFAPGVTTQTVNVSVEGDTLDEPGENFTVNLSSQDNATIFDPQGVGTITDDDVAAPVACHGFSSAGFFAYDPAFSGGIFVASGDVDGDGCADVITGAGPGGGPHVQVFSGRDGSVLYSFFAYDPAFGGGVRVASGDTDGDGNSDIITGVGPGGGPHVQVFSGADNSRLASFFAYDPAFDKGIFVASGDIDGDGKADIITGAGPGGGPHVQVFSGASGAVLQSFFAYDPAFGGGVRVASGDTDGDGNSDIITGVGPGGGPHVQVFSGASGAVLQSFFAYDPAFDKGIFVASGDTDGDGKADIITGAGPGGGPHVQVFSGASVANIRSFFAYDPAFGGGVFVAAGDINGDGRSDIVTGAGSGGGPHVQVF